MASSLLPRPPSGTTISTWCGKSFSTAFALCLPLDHEQGRGARNGLASTVTRTKKSRSAREACGSFRSPIVKRDNRDRHRFYVSRQGSSNSARQSSDCVPHTGVSAPRQSARLFGMRSRPQKPYTSSEDAKLRALAKAGHSRNEIAAAMHRSSSSIYKRAKVLGIRLAVKSPALHVTLRKLR